MNTPLAPALTQAAMLRMGYTYASRQATDCAGCGEYKHTPLRVDLMEGYVCLTCIDQRLKLLLQAEARAAMPAAEPAGWKLVPLCPPDLLLNSFLSGYGARGGSFNAMHLRDRARRGYVEMLASIEWGREHGIEELVLPTVAIDAEISRNEKAAP